MEGQIRIQILYMRIRNTDSLTCLAFGSPRVLSARRVGWRGRRKCRRGPPCQPPAVRWTAAVDGVRWFAVVVEKGRTQGRHQTEWEAGVVARPQIFLVIIR